MRSMSPEIWSNLRQSMANLYRAPKVEPNTTVTVDQVFTPDSHRAVLDLSRQLVVGNRGMGKSLWTHALFEKEVRDFVAKTYSQPQLLNTDVIIGFNGSAKISEVAPSPESINFALNAGFTEDDIWRAVIFRATRKIAGSPEPLNLLATLDSLKNAPSMYDEVLAQVDDELEKSGKVMLILFDALDLLSSDWQQLRQLVFSLLKRILGLKSFKSFRAKVFIRPDQYDDGEIFQFADASKLKNDHVDLTWQSHELFGLLFFEISRSTEGRIAIKELAASLNADAALRFNQRGYSSIDEQTSIINALAGSFMGSDARRGRVYTWVPLHLSDARNACSPRTFLTAWQKAAIHTPAPVGRAVDHLGLIEGVRSASTARLEELREDYRWIDLALRALTGQFVPMERKELFGLWRENRVVERILQGSWLMPIGLDTGDDAPAALLQNMKSISLMEERANGRINVPDIFRVDAGIKRKGGVAVPRRQT
jgi:hypothetical protein